MRRPYRIFSEAYRRTSGLARTVRGPVMSALPGKVLVDGVTELNGDRVFVLKMIQSRDPEWTNRVFFARHDDRATWLSDLEPAWGEAEFFFEEGLGRLIADRQAARPAAPDRRSDLGALDSAEAE